MAAADETPRLDEVLNPVEMALFTQAVATQNALQVLLIRLVEKDVLDRRDIGLIAKGTGRAFTAPAALNNELIADLHRRTDDIFAAIVAALDKRQRDGRG